ncbi:SGNH/GDSL hydrolase family protein, partial [Oceanicella sp. SM1341]|uniref:SGNH/GDSL hydrolase family protein n=1 Tax=Oceanicella sp. SM1341 TaxID=1548889 RepID=UPI0013005598
SGAEVACEVLGAYQPAALPEISKVTLYASETLPAGATLRIGGFAPVPVAGERGAPLGEGEILRGDMVTFVPRGIGGETPRYQVGSIGRAAMRAVLAERVELRGGSGGGDIAWAVIDGEGWANTIATAQGGLKTALFELGETLRTPAVALGEGVSTAWVQLGFGAEFSLQDPEGFIAMRARASGEVELGRALRLGSMRLGVEPGGDLTIADAEGFVGLRLTAAGRLLLMGQEITPAPEPAPAPDPSPAQVAAALPLAEVARSGVYLPGRPILRRWRHALAQAQMGVRPARLACVGDSNTLGVGARLSPGPYRPWSYPALLERIIGPRLACGARSTSLWGAGTATTDFADYWPGVVSPGAGWAISPGLMFGEMLENATTTEPLAFDFGATWDEAEIWAGGGSGAVFTVSNGGETTEYAPADGELVRLTWAAPSRGAEPLVIRRVAGTVRIGAAGTRDTRAPAVEIQLMARGGWRASHWNDTATPWAPQAALRASGADLFVIELGLNEFNGSAPVANYTAQMQTLVTALRGTGADVVLLGPLTPEQGSRTVPWEDYRAAMLQLAVDNALPYLDTGLRAGTAAQLTEDGERNDGLHFGGPAYYHKAVPLGDLLLTL